MLSSVRLRTRVRFPPPPSWVSGANPHCRFEDLRRRPQARFEGELGLYVRRYGSDDTVFVHLCLDLGRRRCQHRLHRGGIVDVDTDRDVVTSVFGNVIDHIATEDFAIGLALQPAVDIDNRMGEHELWHGSSFRVVRDPAENLTSPRPERTAASGEMAWSYADMTTRTDWCADVDDGIER